MGVSKIPCVLVPQRKILPNQLIQTGVSDVTIIQSLRSGHRRGACFVCYRSVLFRQLEGHTVASSGTTSPPLSHGCHAWADWAWVHKAMTQPSLTTPRIPKIADFDICQEWKFTVEIQLGWTSETLCLTTRKVCVRKNGISKNVIILHPMWCFPGCEMVENRAILTQII